MKKLFFIVAFMATAFVQTGFAQQNNTGLLPLYYSVKNALVAGNANLAATKAGEFVEALNNADTKIVSEENREALSKDAGKIAASKDLKSQREHFADFSAKMIAVAKASKLTDEPVYLQYCPMKKSSWLSSEKAIKNPYYGSAMLTCGKVTETLK